MKHIIVLLYTIIVIIGAWAAFYTHQNYKYYKKTFLRDLVHYIVFFNLYVLFYQIVEYLYLNLVGGDLSNLPPIIRIVFYLASLIIQLGMAWTFIRVVIGLQGKSVSQIIERLFYAGIGLAGISYTIGITLYLQTTSSKWMDITYAILAIISMGVIYAAILTVILRKQMNLEFGQQKAVRAFGTLYFIYYTAFFASVAIPSPLNLYISSGLLFLSNCIPPFWLRRYFIKHYVYHSFSDDRSVLDEIVREFHISRREQEIIELILQGKSNKEIKDLLFISFNTVKNHIYNLYQKLGVKSRGQLVHFILEGKKEH